MVKLFLIFPNTYFPKQVQTTPFFVSKDAKKSLTLLLRHHNVHEDSFFSLIIHPKMWLFRVIVKKNFMAPFYGWGSIALKQEPLGGVSLLFTTKFPEILWKQPYCWSYSTFFWTSIFPNLSGSLNLFGFSFSFLDLDAKNNSDHIHYQNGFWQDGGLFL